MCGLIDNTKETVGNNNKNKKKNSTGVADGGGEDEEGEAGAEPAASVADNSSSGGEGGGGTDSGPGPGPGPSHHCATKFLWPILDDDGGGGGHGIDLLLFYHIMIPKHNIMICNKSTQSSTCQVITPVCLLILVFFGDVLQQNVFPRLALWLLCLAWSLDSYFRHWNDL